MKSTDSDLNCSRSGHLTTCGALIIVAREVQDRLFILSGFKDWISRRLGALTVKTLLAVTQGAKCWSLKQLISGELRRLTGDFQWEAI
jgi:hypothetical protein